jgi:hypothetical protein
MKKAKKSRLDCVDELLRRIKQANAIVSLIGLARTGHIPDNAVPYAVWAVRDLLEGCDELVRELHEEASHAFTSRSKAMVAGGPELSTSATATMRWRRAGC